MSKFATMMNLVLRDRRSLKKAVAYNFSKTAISHLIPDKMYLKYMYRAHFGKCLNLKNPATFNEKLNWLKLYNRDPKYIELVDKYEVKRYIAETIGEQYVIPTLGVWNSFEEIDFSSLPNQFVLKCTHDSGSVVICRDKTAFDMEKAREKLQRKLKSNLFWHGREWPYKDVRPCIIAEKYMEDGNNSSLSDYKFYCFNGEPKFLYISQGLENHETARISYVTLDWKQAPFKRNDFENFEALPPKPETFDKMIEFAKTLSQGIPFLRVDFYDIDGQLYFGELTFYPGSGFTAFEPTNWDRSIGGWLKLPQKIK